MELDQFMKELMGDFAQEVIILFFPQKDIDRLKKILDVSLSIQSLDELTKNGLFEK